MATKKHNLKLLVDTTSNKVLFAVADDEKLKYVGNSSNVEMDESGGIVKEVVTYMVMDDLAVMPMSTISSITLLNKFNIKDVGSLQERVVELGMDET
ncbi:hypothetical protein QJS04_geneDACA022801 [Acorus gramineus]|uniref:Uncharacterized protein n=1 Tax=Acorus gramineus TaxID=55184 RepID=A0AAV9B291_ACOGR|nr:hypothetical protein QJS04_geneDACA022801 [Acorus gramineus]